MDVTGREHQQALLDDLNALKAAHDRQIALLNALAETVARTATLDAETIMAVRAIVQLPETSWQTEIAALQTQVTDLADALAAHEREHQTSWPSPWWRHWPWWWRRRSETP